MNATVTLISSPAMKLNETINIYRNGTLESGDDYNNIFLNPVHVGGEFYKSVTFSSMLGEI